MLVSLKHRKEALTTWGSTDFNLHCSIVDDKAGNICLSTQSLLATSMSIYSRNEGPKCVG
jgi:hypothetical protein